MIKNYKIIVQEKKHQKMNEKIKICFFRNLEKKEGLMEKTFLENVFNKLSKNKNYQFLKEKKIN